MITRDFLLKNGFKSDYRSPNGIDDYFLRVRPQGGTISVRFIQGKEEAVGMFAYSENPDHSNVRKVVLNDTIVRKEDYEMAIKICNLI